MNDYSKATGGITPEQCAEIQRCIGDWKQGVTLLTNQTRRWSPDDIKRNDVVEKRRVFENFLVEDEGRSRTFVCEADNEKLAEVIARLPAILTLVAEQHQRIDELELEVTKLKSKALTMTDRATSESRYNALVLLLTIFFFGLVWYAIVGGW